MKNIQQIENYIVYLIGECGLSVTLHPMKEEALITFSRLMQFNTHDNAYCATVKSTKCGHSECVLQQEKVFEKMKREQACFSGVCHAGVFEYVYPLRSTDGIIGFISVGGYTSEAESEKVYKAAKRFGCSKAALSKAYSALKPPFPERERIDTLIYPLCEMLELAYIKEEGDGEIESLTKKIIRYVRQCYSTDLKVEDICKLFGCSRSYFSHTFKKETGKGFREYLTDVRLENARRLLALSELNVTEIAFSIGLLNSNYFSNLFKERYGVSPLAYRKSLKK